MSQQRTKKFGWCNTQGCPGNGHRLAGHACLLCKRKLTYKAEQKQFMGRMCVMPTCVYYGQRIMDKRIYSCMNMDCGQKMQPYKHKGQHKRRNSRGSQSSGDTPYKTQLWRKKQQDSLEDQKLEDVKDIPCTSMEQFATGVQALVNLTAAVFPPSPTRLEEYKAKAEFILGLIEDHKDEARSGELTRLFTYAAGEVLTLYKLSDAFAATSKSQPERAERETSLTLMRLLLTRIQRSLNKHVTLMQTIAEDDEKVRAALMTLSQVSNSYVVHIYLQKKTVAPLDHMITQEPPVSPHTMWMKVCEVLREPRFWDKFRAGLEWSVKSFGMLVSDLQGVDEEWAGLVRTSLVQQATKMDGSFEEPVDTRASTPLSVSTVTAEDEEVQLQEATVVEDD